MADRAAGKIMWFAAGLALGTTVAMLYAPASGRDMRRKIAEKTNQGRTALAETSKDLYDKGRRMIERGRRLADEAADLFERGRKLVEDVMGNDEYALS